MICSQAERSTRTTSVKSIFRSQEHHYLLHISGNESGSPLQLRVACLEPGTVLVGAVSFYTVCHLMTFWVVQAEADDISRYLEENKIAAKVCLPSQPCGLYQELNVAFLLVLAYLLFFRIYNYTHLILAAELP